MSANGIYGLSGSGLDVESMVKAGMMAKQSKLDKMLQSYTKNEWKKEAYVDIYKKVNDLNLNKLTDYKLSSNMNARSATSSDSSIKATANSDAAIGPHTITVNSTAINAYLVGTNSVNDLKKAGSKTLETLGYTSGLTFSINGENGENNITLDKDKTLYELIAEVNGKSDTTGVKMSYDETNGYISLYQKNLGESNTIKITATGAAAEFFGSLGLKDRNNATGNAYSVSDFNDGTVTAIGKDTSVTIDGRDYDKLTSTTIFAENISFNIGGVVVKDGQSVTAIVNVDQDKEKIIDNVKSFVNEYNELLNSIYEAYREAPNSSYKPLTDAQKEEMSADQIEKWEEKAKAGILYHDQTLRKVIDSVRKAVTDKVEGVTGDYDSIYKLGISTTGLYGQLKIDEDKLSKAIAEDPDAVYKVFSTPNKTGNLKDETVGGVAVRLSAALSNSSKTISDVSGKDLSTSDDSTLNTLMRSMQSRISSFKKMMKTFEDNLYKRYDAMESALASLGSQMNYLSGMMSGS